MTEVRCFLLEPTKRVQLRLRRFCFGDNCTACPMSGHDAWVVFPGPEAGAWPARIRNEDHCLVSYEDVGPPHDDSRWPTKCGQCGLPFPDDAQWQVFQELIYRRTDNSGETTLRDAPPGAMYDAEWYPKKGPDGRALCVCLPPDGGLNYWCIDGTAKGGGGWTRTGTPPNVTANPSILTPRYHGWLRNGVLVSC
jgi:hypothetical protein